MHCEIHAVMPALTQFQSSRKKRHLRAKIHTDRDAEMLSKILANNIERTVHHDQPPRQLKQ